MLISETGKPARPGSEELLDRVVQLRRLLAGATSENVHLKRELLLLRRANRSLERELQNVVHARRKFRTHSPVGTT